MTKFRKPHRTTYERLLEFMRALSSGTTKSIPDLSAAEYQNWLFGKELGFLERRDRAVELTSLGEKLLSYGSDDERRRLFKTRLERAPSFSRIWNAILQWSYEYKPEIPRAEMLRLVQEVTRPKAKVMLEIYTSSILNWATNARLIERIRGARSGVYKVLRQAEFGAITEKMLTEAPSSEKAVAPSIGADYLDKVSLLVYDVIHRPGDAESYLAELRRITASWIQNPPGAGLSDDQRRIVLNELNYILEVGGKRAFEMLAETLAIIRGEKTRQMKFVEYAGEGAKSSPT
jgi:hypothetical protein